jgi:phage head maturation protease
LPKTADGDKALELIQRGDISGCSFIYSTDERDSENAVSYELSGEKTEDGDDILLRHVKRIDNVYDFTITPKPAYEQTTVSKREVEEAGVVFGKPAPTPAPKTIDLAKKREAIREVKERINRTV